MTEGKMKHVLNISDFCA